MGDYSLTPSAQADLEEIWAFIASDNPETADILESDIFEVCQLLAGQPQMGMKRPRWTDLPVRFWIVRRNYFIVCKPDSNPLQILRILHAAQDIPKLLGGS